MRFAPPLYLAVVTSLACALVGCAQSGANKPAAPMAVAPAAPSTLQGTVLEVLPATPYTYLRLKAAQGEVWAAVPAAALKVGDPATVQVQLKMDKFQSAALNRTFDSVYLGTLAGAAPAAPAAAPAQPVMAAQPGPGTAMPGAAAVPAHAQPAFSGMEKVPKAAGPDGYAIAELYARKDKLNDRTVVVKAKVTKVLNGIMGKTWFHLSDGTGQPQQRNFDLAVTTEDTAKVGDIVTVKGTLRADKDFGSGYVYPVILEDAKVVR